MSGHMQIGEVAGRVELSIRTIRYYEEVGLVEPSARSQGGFRLYTESDVARLEVVRRMKVLGLQLDEMRDLLRLLTSEAPDGSLTECDLAQLGKYWQQTEDRCRHLRQQMRMAEEFVVTLQQQVSAQAGSERGAEPR